MFDIDDSFWAHTKDQKEPETLITHTNLTKNYLENIKIAKNLTPLIDNLTTEILEKTNSLEFKNLLLEIFDNLIIWHDIGKTNPAFQAIKMKNKAYKKGFDSSTHSDKSFQKIKEFYKNRVLETKNSTIIYLFYHLLSNVLNHHGELKDGLNYSELDETGLDADFRNINKKGLDDYRVYIFIKLHFSLLIASDFYATSEYMNDIKTICFGTFDKVLKDEIYLKFHNFYESLNKTKPIDKLRTKIFNETAKNLNKNLDKNLFYLEAPTGSGKTLTSLNLALNLLKSDEKLNKIFYIFPFNTLITQTESLISKIFENHLDFAVINSITAPKFSDQENEETKYDKTYINRMFFNHHLILTSHVNLFDILFGVLKESNYPLFSLATSVIIIDEIQSYDPNLWEYMAYFFDKFAKLLNIKFIIMSATLPKISKLLKSDDDWCDLLPNSDEIFQNPLFKERVKVDYSLLKTPKEVIFDEMIKVAKSSKKEKILFEFITKNSAREFYNYIKDKFDEYEIYELSGDDNKLYRDLIINKSKSSIKLIIVATQVIEVGVDIDMDLGFKDISILESEEQFLGRVNRNSTKSEAVVYFFDYFDSNKIYKDDRTKFSLKDKKWQDALKSKNFSRSYKPIKSYKKI